MIGGGGVSKMSAAAARRRRTALLRSVSGSGYLRSPIIHNILIFPLLMVVLFVYNGLHFKFI